MNNTDNGNQPAYPTMDIISDHRSGLTKREAFAMAAMTGLLANPEVNCNEEHIAKYSVEHATALIAELSKEAK